MFDRYAAATAPSWGRRALVMASVVVHVSAAIVLAIWSVCHIAEIPPPPIALRFFSLPAPTPPPPAGGGTTAHRRPKVEHAPSALVEPKQPTVAQTEPPASAQTDDGPGEPTGQPDGVPGGQPDGVPGGQPNGQPDGHGKAPATVPAFVLASQQLEHAEPHVDDAFKAQHPSQVVRGSYRVCVGTDGHVSDVTPLLSIPGQDASIMSQIRSGWVYKARPLPVCAVSAVVFKIN